MKRIPFSQVLKTAAIDIRRAVSYTHLDVYKRQAARRPKN